MEYINIYKEKKTQRLRFDLKKIFDCPFCSGMMAYKIKGRNNPISKICLKCGYEKIY